MKDYLIYKQVGGGFEYLGTLKASTLEGAIRAAKVKYGVYWPAVQVKR